jgi:hypothetical protein
VTAHLIAVYLVQTLTLAILLTLLGVQIRAFRRYGHVSFLLLLLGTVCELLNLGSMFCFGYFAFHGGAWMDPWLPNLAAVLHVAAMLLGLWGMLSLFSAYGKLAAAAAPNNRWSGRDV